VRLSIEFSSLRIFELDARGTVKMIAVVAGQ